MRPMVWVFSSPIAFQVLPPSVDLKIPRPGESELRELTSPVPNQTWFVSLGAIASMPPEITPSSPLPPKHQPEGGAGVGGLPDASRRRGDIERAGRAGESGDIADPPAHVGGADVAPAEAGDERGVDPGRGDLGGEQRRGRQETQQTN
jgi:hypothetical protein